MFCKIVGLVNIAGAVIIGPTSMLFGFDPEWDASVFYLILGIWVLEGDQ